MLTKGLKYFQKKQPTNKQWFEQLNKTYGSDNKTEKDMLEQKHK